MVLVVALTAIVLALVSPKVVGDPRQARTAAALYEISALKKAIETFRRDTGFYPQGTNGLIGLVSKPTGITNWMGPYMQYLPIDPWGRDFVYDYPGRHTEVGYPYDLYSLGPLGDTSVVANWSSQSIKP